MSGKKRQSLRDIGRELEERSLLGRAVDRTAGQVDRDRLSDVLFPRTPVVWSERGWEGMLSRMTEIRARLDEMSANGEEPTLSKAEQEDLETIVHAMTEALQPVIAAFRELAEHFVGWMGDLLTGETWAQLANLAMAVGEPEQQVDVVTLINGDGDVIGSAPITPLPAAAVGHVAILPDEEQVQETFPLSEPAAKTGSIQVNVQPLIDPRSPSDIAVERALRHPFTDPFSVNGGL